MKLGDFADGGDGCIIADGNTYLVQTCVYLKRKEKDMSVPYL